MDSMQSGHSYIHAFRSLIIYVGKFNSKHQYSFKGSNSRMHVNAENLFPKIKMKNYSFVPISSATKQNMPSMDQFTVERLQQVVLAHHLVVSSNFKLNGFDPQKVNINLVFEIYTGLYLIWYIELYIWTNGREPKRSQNNVARN